MDKQEVLSFEVLLGRRIKAVRALRGISQRQLAEKCGISNQTLSNIECGKSDFRLSSLKAIEGVLNYSLLKISHDDIFEV